MSNSIPMQFHYNVPQTSTFIQVSIKVPWCIFLIVQIAMGAVHLDDCPRQPYIPIYLIVGGVFSLVWKYLPCTLQPLNLLSQVSLGCKSLLAAFRVAWFIAGSVWVYSIYEPNYHKNVADSEPYCDESLYRFAFWITTLFYIEVVFFVGVRVLVMVLVRLFLCSQAGPNDLV